jgi:transposase InsO family protein
VLRVPSQLPARVAGLAARAMRALRDACRPSGVASGFISDLTRSRAELITENALLRQQLIVASRAVKRPAFRVHERGPVVLLARFLPQWRQAVLLVKPETVLRWHREGFRSFWRRKSRSLPREPRLAPDVVALIERMAIENRLWGAERIRGELLKLGIATPFGQGPQFIIRDRDDKFGVAFDRVAAGVGARVVRTAVRAPLMNAVCERFLGSVRRECLDHIVALSEAHLRHVLVEYPLSYFNRARPHQGIGQRTPAPGERTHARLASSITAIPVLGGLHHDYSAAA